MKLYQALKEKNKLAGEIKELEGVILSKNSRIKTEVNHIDVVGALEDLALKRKQLITLKSNISVANAPIQEKIYVLAELKSEAAFYNRMPTKEGTVNTNHYGNPNIQEFEVTLNELEVSKKKKELKEQIEKVQEQLDYFNHTTDL